jgi:hypothetical protein
VDYKGCGEFDNCWNWFATVLLYRLLVFKVVVTVVPSLAKANARVPPIVRTACFASTAFVRAAAATPLIINLIEIERTSKERINMFDVREQYALYKIRQKKTETYDRFFHRSDRNETKQNKQENN